MSTPGFLGRLQQYYDKLTQPESFGTEHGLGTVGNAGVTALSDLGAGTIGLLNPLMHPIKTAKTAIGLAGAGLQAPNPFTQEAEEGLVRPLIRKPNESGKNYAQRLAGQAVSMIPPIALGAAGKLPASSPVKPLLPEVPLTTDEASAGMNNLASYMSNPNGLAELTKLRKFYQEQAAPPPVAPESLNIPKLPTPNWVFNEAPPFSDWNEMQLQGLTKAHVPVKLNLGPRLYRMNPKEVPEPMDMQLATKPAKFDIRTKFGEEPPEGAVGKR